MAKIPAKTMNFLIVILLLFDWIDSYSQSAKSSQPAYDSIPGEVFLSKDNLQDKFGVYRLGESLGGTGLSLDSTMHFQKWIYACVGGGGIIDSGTWFLLKSGRIGLKSKSGLQTLVLMKYQHYYFCVPPKKRVKFINDFQQSKTLHKNIKTIHIGDLDYTGNDLASYSLKKNYYFRDVNDQ